MAGVSGADWVVLKFGGTSVTGRSQWDTIARLAQQRMDEGHRVLLVCSALAGITDDLQALAGTDAGRHGDPLTDIVDRYSELGEALGVHTEDLLSSAAHSLVAAVDRVQQAGDASERAAAWAEVMAHGEWLTTQVGARFLAERMACTWVDARTALRVLPEAGDNPERSWLSARCQPGPDAELRGRWETLDGVLITQGFVAAGEDGRTALLGRGGSDTSAALLAGRLGASRVEIWTDVAGIFSADPRLVPEARLIPRLDVGEALEMAAGGARVVHPRALHAASATATPMWIRDTGQPGQAGTEVVPEQAAESGLEDGIRAVTLQRDMAVLLLENRDIRQQVGFLAGVFDAISRQGVSIDLVATSETTTTLAIQRGANHLDEAALAALESALQARSLVTVFPSAVTVNVVGRGVRHALARLAPLGRWLQDHPVLMVSQSANDRCLSLVVESGSAEELARLIHTEMLSERAARIAS